MGVLLQENGTLYGGQDSPGDAVDTLSPNTGLATVGPAPGANFSGSFYGLAENPLTETPEPATLTIAGAGLLTLGFVTRKRRKIAT